MNHRVGINKKGITMNENESKQVQGAENEVLAAEIHAPWQVEQDTERFDNPQESTTSSSSTSGHALWQLEKDTEGLDNPQESTASSSSTSGSEEEGKKSSDGCGCKYF